MKKTEKEEKAAQEKLNNIVLGIIEDLKEGEIVDFGDIHEILVKRDSTGMGSIWLPVLNVYKTTDFLKTASIGANSATEIAAVFERTGVKRADTTMNKKLFVKAYNHRGGGADMAGEVEASEIAALKNMGDEVEIKIACDDIRRDTNTDGRHNSHTGKIVIMVIE